MKKHVSLLFAFVITSTLCFAQQSALYMSMGKPLKSKKSGNTVGSPYLNEEFQKAEITTNNGKKLTDLPIRYDELNQHIEYSIDNNLYDITDSVSKFTVPPSENHTGNFTKIKTADSKAPVFLELVAPGKLSIYKLTTVKVNSEEDFYTKRVTQKLEPMITYYAFDGTKYQKIGNGKKDFQNFFKSNDKVKEIIKADDFNFNSDNSIAALAQAIN